MNLIYRYYQPNTEFSRPNTAMVTKLLRKINNQMLSIFSHPFLTCAIPFLRLWNSIQQIDMKMLSQKQSRSISWNKFNFKTFQDHDSGFYQSSKKALHEHFIADWWWGVWKETLQLTPSIEKSVYCNHAAFVKMHNGSMITIPTQYKTPWWANTFNSKWNKQQRPSAFSLCLPSCKFNSSAWYASDTMCKLQHTM